MYPQNRADSLSPLPSRPDRYFRADTIAALASASGGAISVVRISGPRSVESLIELTGVKKDNWHHGKMTLVSLRAPQEPHDKLDQAMACVFYSPRSYTGESVVELYLHGGTLVAEAVLDALATLGIASALPGEFSFRAVQNGKLTLPQAQGVADLIAASSSGAAQLALYSMDGVTARWIQELRDQMMDLVAQSELGIDFSDQAIDSLALPNLKGAARRVLERLTSIRETFSRGRRVREGIRVAIIGPPNAGKSSLFNALLGEERAIVSDTPGTTRDVLDASIRLGVGHNERLFLFQDTAGLRKSSDTLELAGMQKSLASARRADLILILMDRTSLSSERVAKETLNQQIAMLAPSLEQLPPIVLGLTKADLEPLRFQWSHTPAVELSSVVPGGLNPLLAWLGEWAKVHTSVNLSEAIISRSDQFEALCSAISSLERALSAPSEDLFAADLRLAQLELAPLTGHQVTDDILGKIFQDFCIGK